MNGIVPQTIITFPPKLSPAKARAYDFAIALWRLIHIKSSQNLKASQSTNLWNNHVETNKKIPKASRIQNPISDRECGCYLFCNHHVVARFLGLAGYLFIPRLADPQQFGLHIDRGNRFISG